MPYSAWQPYVDLGLPLLFLLAFAFDPRAGADGVPPAWWRSPLLWLGGTCFAVWLYRFAMMNESAHFAFGLLIGCQVAAVLFIRLMITWIQGRGDREVE